LVNEVAVSGNEVVIGDIEGESVGLCLEEEVAVGGDCGGVVVVRVGLLGRERLIGCG
jgi:hypothetical protein